MAGTETDLANVAFSMVREDPIADLQDPDDNKAKEAKRLFYNVVRGSVLRAFDWNCVRTQQLLAVITNPRPQEWVTAFALPNDPFCLAARRIVSMNVSPYPTSFEPLRIPFEVIGRTLLCNESAAMLIYTYLETNTGAYDDLLFDSMATRLAAELAFSRLGNFKRGQELMVIYNSMKTPEAAGVNEAEGVGAKTLYTPSNILAVRRGW